MNSTYIVAAIGAILLLVLATAVIMMMRRRRRMHRYPEHPDGVRRCASCGALLKPGATDCSKCGSDSVVIVV